jgi:hypothetical protein
MGKLGVGQVGAPPTPPLGVCSARNALMEINNDVLFPLLLLNIGIRRSNSKEKEFPELIPWEVYK